jgi:hypothetical protein
LLTSGWRSPAYSSSGARRVLWRRPTLPPPRPQSPPRRALAPQRRTPAPPRRTQAPPRCAPPLSRAAWRRTLPHPPQATSPLPPPQPWVRGALDPISRGELVPHRSPPPPRPTRVLRSHRGGESLLLAQPKLLTLFPALSPPDSLLLLARRPLPLPPLRYAPARARGVGGSDCAASTAITCKGRVKLQVMTMPRRSIERRGEGIHSPTGRRGA